MIWLIVLKFWILLNYFSGKNKSKLYTAHKHKWIFPVSGCWNVSGTPHIMYMAITEMGCGFDRRVGFV